MKLLCDICGGQLQMTAANDGATCVNCGMNYSIESLRNKLGGQNAAGAPAAQPETPEEEIPIAQVESAEESIPVAKTEPVQKAQSAHAASVFFTEEAPAMRSLVFERKIDKFSLWAQAYNVAVILDGEEVATLGPKGGRVSIPVTQGNHDVYAVVYAGNGQVDGALDTFNIQVGEHDWYGVFYVRRDAWKAYWQMELAENILPNIMTIEDLFVIAGKGTVITGTVQSGKISVGDSVVINNKTFVVSGLESYKKMINTASEGMGIGMLLQNVGKNDLKVGDLVYKKV